MKKKQKQTKDKKPKSVVLKVQSGKHAGLSKFKKQ